MIIVPIGDKEGVTMVNISRLSWVHHVVTGQYRASNFELARAIFEECGGESFLNACEQELPVYEHLGRLFLANLWYFYGQLFISLNARQKAIEGWTELSNEESEVSSSAGDMLENVLPPKRRLQRVS